MDIPISVISLYIYSVSHPPTPILAVCPAVCLLFSLSHFFLKKVLYKKILILYR